MFRRRHMRSSECCHYVHFTICMPLNNRITLFICMTLFSRGHHLVGYINGILFSQIVIYPIISYYWLGRYFCVSTLSQNYTKIKSLHIKSVLQYSSGMSPYRCWKAVAHISRYANIIWVSGTSHIVPGLLVYHQRLKLGPCFRSLSNAIFL